MFLLIALLVSYLVATGAYFLLTKRALARWVGGVALLVAAPFFFWAGLFANQFDSGQCYSGVVAAIANSLEATADPKALVDRIRALPLAGYETNCYDVLKESELLPSAVRPNNSLERSRDR